MKHRPKKGFLFMRNYIKIFLVQLECFIIKVPTQWTLRCQQYKHNYKDANLHTYVLTFAQPHKNKLKRLFTKKGKVKLSGYCKKIRVGGMIMLPMKEQTLSIKDVVKKLVQRFFLSPLISCFNPISEFSKIQKTSSWVLLSSNLTYVPHILKGEIERQKTEMTASIKH